MNGRKVKLITIKSCFQSLQYSVIKTNGQDTYPVNQPLDLVYRQDHLPSPSYPKMIPTMMIFLSVDLLDK